MIRMDRSTIFTDTGSFSVGTDILPTTTFPDLFVDSKSQEIWKGAYIFTRKVSNDLCEVRVFQYASFQYYHIGDINIKKRVYESRKMAFGMANFSTGRKISKYNKNIKNNVDKLSLLLKCINENSQYFVYDDAQGL